MEKKGPRSYRFLMMTLYVVFGLLLFWFLGFLMDDIANRPGPNLTQVQKKYQDPQLVKDKEAYSASLKDLSTTIEQKRQQLGILQTSITSYKDTMNQLLDLQKASIQKGVNFSPESNKNLQNVTNLYLNYQNQFQELNGAITTDNLKAQGLQNKIQEINTKLSKQNEEAYKEYKTLWETHNWTMAALQLLVLIPLLLIAAFLYKKYRQGKYKSMIMAALLAIFFKTSLVMHEYFPSFLFKYLLVMALLFITIKVLISMIRNMSSPKPTWLLKQYKEAYQKGQCPSCQFGIKPSIAKFVTEEGTIPPNYLETVDSYTCPSCGEQLFEKCNNCSHVRYSLLEFCDHCGVNKKS